MKKIKSVLSVLLLIALVFNLTACSIRAQASDLMQGVSANEVSPLADLGDGNAAISDFAISVFRETLQGDDNTLISPLSLYLALAMTANGADGQTKEQMESVLGADIDDLNRYLYTLVNSLPQEKKNQLHIANSIWFKDSPDFKANEDFLQANADYYGAGAFKSAFDEQTAKDINRWVKQNTDGMIDDVLDEIPSEAVMYLVNALSFEAEWNTKYEKDQIEKGFFTSADGEKENADFMYQTLHSYLETDNASGFMKHYENGNYAFAALLPNENLSLSEFVSTLDGEKLQSILNNEQDVEVKTAIPKFEVEYDNEMSGILKKMGMDLAFDEDRADFSELGKGRDNIYMGRVLHKTYISVAEKGTRAGAATVIEMMDKCAMPQEEKIVILNRPFIYMIIDCENNVPIFLGALNEID